MTQTDIPASMQLRSNQVQLRYRLLLILLVAGFLLWAMWNHRFHINSHYYFHWRWRSLNVRPIVGLFLACSVPLFIAQIIYAKRPDWVWVCIALLMISMFGMMLSGEAVQASPLSLNRISEIVQNGGETGYYAAALSFKEKGMGVVDWLSRFPQLQKDLLLHPRVKPPGWVLFETGIVNVLGDGNKAAMTSGLLVVLGSVWMVPTTYLFILYFTEDRSAAFFGATYLALAPAAVLWVPMYDLLYPILTCGLAILWAMALRSNRIRYAAAFGILYAMTTFFTYLPLSLGFFLLGLTILSQIEKHPASFQPLVALIATAVISIIGFYVLLWVLFRFNSLATFLSSLANQRDFNITWAKSGRHPRHLPGTIPMDLYDFALGSGWISYFLVAYYFINEFRHIRTHNVRIALLCVVQIVAVAVTGMIQSETSRVWLFMLPLLLVPVGLEFAKWPAWMRMAVFAALLLITMMMCQSMTFA